MTGGRKTTLQPACALSSSEKLLTKIVIELRMYLESTEEKKTAPRGGELRALLRLEQRLLFSLQGPAHVFEGGQQVLVAVLVSQFAKAILDLFRIPHFDARIELALAEIEYREELVSGLVDSSFEQLLQTPDPVAYACHRSDARRVVEEPGAQSEVHARR